MNFRLFYLCCWCCHYEKFHGWTYSAHKHSFGKLNCGKFESKLWHSCHFDLSCFQALGHMVTADGRKPYPKKLVQLLKWIRPTTVINRSWYSYSFVHYLRDYIPICYTLQHLWINWGIWNILLTLIGPYSVTSPSKL